MKLLSIVIPMYRSEHTIESVVRELQGALESLPYRSEILLVNDCSPDGVLHKAYALMQSDSRIRVIDIAKNGGQPNAMITGYRYANGDYIVSMDDDFQHPAGAIPDLLAALEREDWDVAFAKYATHRESAFRRFGSRVNQLMAAYMAGKPKGVESNSFFAMRRFVRDALLAYRGRNPYIYGIIYAATSHIGNVPVEHRARSDGRSGFTFGKLLSFWLNGVISFSIKPLRIASLLGMGISLVTAVVAVVMLINRLLHPDVGVMGWTSLILAIMFFAGIQLVGIGMLGEYLGRLYLVNSALPTSCVRSASPAQGEEKDDA